MPSYPLRPEMSPIEETNKYLMNQTAAAQDGSMTGRDDATRRDSIFPSEIDGGEYQHTQTAFETLQSDHKTRAIPQQSFHFKDKPKDKTKRPAGIEDILQGPEIHRPNLNRTF